MMDAKTFFEKSVEEQRKFIDSIMEEAANKGQSIIPLPFNVYPIIEDELDEAGYTCISYTKQDTNIKYTCFYPNQLTKDYEDN